MGEEERDYFAFQYSLFAALSFEVLGGIVFLISAIYVVADKQKADEYIESKLRKWVRYI